MLTKIYGISLQVTTIGGSVEGATYTEQSDVPVTLTTGDSEVPSTVTTEQSSVPDTITTDESEVD